MSKTSADVARARSGARGIAVGVGVAVLALVAAGAWFVASHRHSVPASTERAESEFAQLRTRFSGQQALLDMDRRVPREEGDRSRAAAPLHTFHTLIFDTRGGQRLVRITVPYWFGRLFAGKSGEYQWLGQLTFLDDTEFDPESIRLPLNALQRRGPGLVADYRHATGGQFIAWVD